MAKKPKGIVRLWHRGRLLWECENLFVNAGLTALANLIAGVTAGQYVSVIGFGSGTAAPAVGDTGLTSPYYFKSIDSYSFPSAGSAQFNYSLKTTDTGVPNPLSITELGLFANSGSVALPGGIQPTPLIAHVSVPLFSYTGGGNYSGTWTLTF